MKTCKLDSISFEENGQKIAYHYTVSNDIKEYFRLDNLYYVLYDKDVSAVPKSLAVIPLLSNIMPISWFVGFDVYIDELDETFYNSLKIFKEQFIKFHPEKEIKGTLHVNNIVKNQIDGTNTSLLFSGGLDSYDSLTRN